jgi:hypothetical protein
MLRSDLPLRLEYTHEYTQVYTVVNSAPPRYDQNNTVSSVIMLLYQECLRSLSLSIPVSMLVTTLNHRLHLTMSAPDRPLEQQHDTTGDSEANANDFMSGEEIKPTGTMGWDGPNDPSNPLNWSPFNRNLYVVVVSLFTLVALVVFPDSLLFVSSYFFSVELRPPYFS